MKAKLVCESLNETNMIDIDIKDLNINKFIELQRDKGFLDEYAYQYLNEEPNDGSFTEDNITEIFDDTEFLQWLKYELEYRFENLKDKFDGLIHNGKILLYRAMTVKSDYIESLLMGKIKRIGQFYSYEFEGAITHWGYGNGLKDKIIFEIDINEEYIDWVDTFRLNLEHEYLNDENEIRLFKNTPVNITNIWWNNKQIDKSSIDKINQHNIIT